MAWISEFFEQAGQWISSDMPGLFSYFTMASRLLLPVLGLIVVIRALRSLLRGEDDGEEWGYLSLPNGARIPLNHWENVIGRSKASDAVVDYPTLSRSHAAVIRDSAGLWRVYDIGAKSGVLHNGVQVDGQAELTNGDTLTLGGVEMLFVSMGPVQQALREQERPRPGRFIRPAGTLVFLTEFIAVAGLQMCIAQGADLTAAVPVSFGALIALLWLSYAVTRLLRRTAFEIETLAFFLCAIGMTVTASSAPGELYKQTILLTCGVIGFFLIGWFLRELGRAVRLRWPIAVAGLALLGLNLLLSTPIFGARNWLAIGELTFQPSEFVKIAFVFAGAATLDRLFARRNLVLFIAFSGACVIALALMKDFGTALVFFVAYLTISFIRSGDLATVFLSVGGAALAGFLAVTYKQHIAARFATWGHAWEVAHAGGYQQTRAMSAAASGGLFGLGAGGGWLKNIFAADTDLVFGMMCEELGLIVAVTAALSVTALAFYAVRASKTARSSYYVVGACAAASILLFQMLLNTLGSVDILPFTGVTFPFVSRGGSSLIACWGLLAFIKAVDTRRSASFIVAAPKRMRKKQLREPEEY